MLNVKRVQRIIEAGIKSSKTNEGQSRIEDIRLCTEGFAEPGYNEPESGLVAFGNWNDISRWDAAMHESVIIDDTPSRIATLLEKLGVELEWSDEWACCDQCGKAVRTSPDSNRWKPSFWQDGSGSITCCNCIAEDPADYLDALEEEVAELRQPIETTPKEGQILAPVQPPEPPVDACPGPQRKDGQP